MYSIVIPARYASTRLPGKPLAQIDGKPMIEHVYQRASASAASEVVVATDDPRVVAAVQGFGGIAVLTRADHPSGTDRLNEVAELRAYADEHIVVNLQGDEPLMPVAVIEQVASDIASAETAGIATLCEPINSVDELLDPNVVKVVRSDENMALYFSRAPVPFARDAAQLDMSPGEDNYRLSFKQQPLQQQLQPRPDTSAAQSPWYRHIGLYAYRVAVLRQFVSWPLAPAEALEKLEQLRALHNGVGIHCSEACQPVPAGVDTAADLQRVQQAFAASH
ncbi:MAG: 3-deoxy-manno-octulosonate cytidylyltransferase [Pseudomonadales bacterium]|nr:3-deoxy-manno-octulosonate cytidylyltransferase [Pseudomonadales bacterium]